MNNFSKYEEAILKIQFAEQNNQSELDLRDLGLEEVDSRLLESTVLHETLRTLYLQLNKLSVFPADIKKFSKLEYLNLAHNNLEMLPSEIGELSCLEEIFLSQNQFTELPKEIGKLSKLRNIDIAYNGKNIVFPQEIGNLQPGTKIRIDQATVENSKELKPFFESIGFRWAPIIPQVVGYDSDVFWECYFVKN